MAEPETIDWNTFDWTSLPNPAGIDLERFGQVIKHILDEPLRFNMADWIRARRGSPYAEAVIDREGTLPVRHVRRWPACNTVACFSGWECLLFGSAYDTSRDTADRLRLPTGRLFFASYDRSLAGSGWPEHLVPTSRPGTRAYAEECCAAFKDFIETGGWPNA